MFTVENENANSENRVLTVSDLERMESVELLELLTLSLPSDNDNASIIIRAVAAAAAAGTIQPSHRDLIRMVAGSSPENYHTYNEWKAHGRIVKHGEHAKFTARIWKHIERRGTLTAEQAETINAVIINADGSTACEGDEIRSSRFIKKDAYFFGFEQTEPLTELEELPNDCEKRIENGKEIISGNTRPIKEQLKASGYRWHKQNRYWYKYVA